MCIRDRVNTSAVPSVQLARPQLVRKETFSPNVCKIKIRSTNFIIMTLDTCILKPSVYVCHEILAIFNILFLLIVYTNKYQYGICITMEVDTICCITTMLSKITQRTSIQFTTQVHNYFQLSRIINYV